MNDPETSFEQNLTRMLKASYSPEARATATLREKLRSDLVANLRHQPAPAEFSGTALGLLTMVIFMLFAACATGGWRAGAGWLGGLMSSPLMLLVILNLVGIPVAGLIIVLRRKYA